MKHLIVLNQKAGAEKQLEEFRNRVDEAFKGLDYEVYLTEGPRAVPRKHKRHSESLCLWW